MNTTLKALQDLYVALGGEASDVADCTTNVEVLNAISAKYDGADDASLNPVAIDNIVEVMDDILGIKPTGTKTITSNGTHDVTEYESASVNVPNPSTGSLEITENGTYDVTEKASAVVNVSGELTPCHLGSVIINNTTGAKVQIKGVSLDSSSLDGEYVVICKQYLVDANTQKEVSIPIDSARVSGNLKGGVHCGDFRLYKNGGVDPANLTATISEGTVALLRDADSDNSTQYMFVIKITCNNPADTPTITIGVAS